jgi:hypothetical protein
MKSFEVSILPPTFAQVCAIALELGYSFVWIDSLCIIQDSSADVRAELSTMANIYESAAVTLAATASEDSKGGCERSRDEYLHNECVLMVSASDRYHDRQCLYIAPEMWERRKDMSFNFFTKVDMAPLNQRAWVFQERLLSRRILHFGDGVLLFECNSMRATDIYHPGVEYDKEESFHANGRICTQTDTYYRHSPRYRFNNALSSLVDTFEARCLDAEVYDKTLIKFVVNTIYRMANTGISGDPYEFTKLHEITERLPNSIQNEVIKEWKALVYQYSSLTKDEAKEIYLPATVATAGRRGALDMLCSPCVNPQALTETEQLKRHRRWYELVSECSGRGITKRSDRLIAMSGLAQRIQKASGIEYYAGLWKSTLAYDLLWIRSKSTPRAKRRKEPSFAPSWSWASSAGKVESALVAVDIATEKRTDIMKYSKIQVDIIEVTVMMDGQQASGQETIIDAGRIRLRGWMKSVTLSEYPIVPDFDLRKKRMKYVCLVIFSQAKRGSYKGTWLGLLLERTSDTTHQYYERRGVVLVEEGICDWPEENGWRRKTITLI